MLLVQQFEGLFYGILSILAVMLVLCLIRAVIGPRIADRLVAVNMMGTMVMVSIALLAVVVLTRIYTGVYREAKDHEHQKEEKHNGNS